MRYAQIRRYDVANGPGIRTSFFVTGCTHNCYLCFNQEYQDFNFGQIWTDEQTNKVIKYLEDEVVDGLTILGGEPFQNAKDLRLIVKKIKEHSNKSIWIYSGYTYEQILKDKYRKELLSYCDYLVDGLFINELKDLRLKFRGSSNQRIINIKQTQQQNRIVLWDE